MRRFKRVRARSARPVACSAILLSNCAALYSMQPFEWESDAHDSGTPGCRVSRARRLVRPTCRRSLRAGSDARSNAHRPRRSAESCGARRPRAQATRLASALGARRRNDGCARGRRAPPRRRARHAAAERRRVRRPVSRLCAPRLDRQPRADAVSARRARARLPTDPRARSAHSAHVQGHGACAPCVDDRRRSAGARARPRCTGWRAVLLRQNPQAAMPRAPGSSSSRPTCMRTMY